MAASALEPIFLKSLKQVLHDLHLSLDDEVREKVLSHYRLLVQWNQRMNLTTLSDPAEIARRHFGESLFLAREMAPETRTVLDVGSGPGFPGLPLAAWRGDLQVTLLESQQRKTVFLREVSRSWRNVQVRNGRLETLEGTWHSSVMRAVALKEALPHLARLTESAAILTGEEGIDEARRSGLYAWEEPQIVPWGKRRFLFKGVRRRA